MKKREKINRWVVKINFYCAKSDQEKAQSDLTKEVYLRFAHQYAFEIEEIVFTELEAPEPHVSVEAFYYMYGKHNLKNFNRKMLEVSATVPGAICVIDYDNKVMQSYQDGEYLEGMFSNGDVSFYEEELKDILRSESPIVLE